MSKPGIGNTAGKVQRMRVTPARDHPHPPCSRRESDSEAMRLWMGGWTVGEIAAYMNQSTRYVKRAIKREARRWE